MQTRSVSRYFPPFSGGSSGILADALVVVLVVILLGIAVRIGVEMLQVFDPPITIPQIDLNPINLPHYTIRSTMRMFIALLCSVIFTILYGSLAAKSKIGSSILVPLLDVLQSVPVLGFLSVSVTWFLAMFPGSLLGLECASIFAIFTSQAWNMTFSFYYSLTSLSKELEQTAALFRLSRIEKFLKVELPSGAIGLVWNGMVSFGGGWFFVAASEAISVINKTYMLPGIGSYVTMAIAAKDVRALCWAVLAITIVLVAVDQFFWSPLVAWSDRFRFDKTGGNDAPTSWFLELLKASHLIKFCRFLSGAVYYKIHSYFLAHWHITRVKTRSKFRSSIMRHQLGFGILMGVVICFAMQFVIRFVGQEVSLYEFLLCIFYGFCTFLRVLILVIVSTMIWTPLGVMIGFNPRIAKYIQPLVQFLVCFPANFVFPVATIFFIKYGISLDFGSLVLMSLGAQWYILFNSIAGASMVPNDLREMVTNMRLGLLYKWKHLIGPAIFPTWVTGAVTASGGAWNASIVSEIVYWGNDKLTAHGLGAYVANAAAIGDWPRLFLGVSLMCIFVVSMNRLLWKRLYVLAEERYRLV